MNDKRRREADQKLLAAPKTAGPSGRERNWHCAEPRIGVFRSKLDPSHLVLRFYFAVLFFQSSQPANRSKEAAHSSRTGGHIVEITIESLIQLPFNSL